MQRKKISIVVPVHNEEASLEALYTELVSVFGDLDSSYGYELIFVDDGSSDGSVSVMQGIKAKNVRVSYVEFSRNFGKEAALSSGIAKAKGDAVILMDADLQHPPRYIKEFISAWEKGAEVVIGVRAQNPDEGWFRSVCSKVFAGIMRTVSDLPTVSGATDFRLLDKSVAEAFLKFTERERITRGLIDWLGFKRAYVPFDARARFAGKAQYSYRKLFGLTLSALVSHSLIPLRLAGYLGFFITFFAGALGLFILVEQLILGDPLVLQIPATAMLAVMILFLNGVLLICLGLMSLYIEKIQRETVNRPLYVERTPRKDT
jgi:dolichol-phosphate mannosyltransferase